MLHTGHMGKNVIPTFHVHFNLGNMSMNFKVYFSLQLITVYKFLH